jgi:hypothetical protein
MKINLDHEILALFKNNKNNKFLIKIIDIKSGSSVISLNGKLLEIPFVLKNNKIYYGQINNNKLNIIEKDIQENLFKSESGLKDDKITKFKNLLDSLLNNESKDITLFDNMLKYLNFFEKDKNINEKGKGAYYFNDKSDKNLFFIFDLPFYNKPSKFFINVNDTKSVLINIFTEKANEINMKLFIENLKKALTIDAKNIILKVNYNKDDFYNEIIKCINKNVDIKI